MSDAATLAPAAANCLVSALLMAGEVRLSNVAIVEAPHKGTRGGPSAEVVGERRLIELSHVIEDGMVTLPNLPGPALSTHMSRAESVDHYAPGTEFEIGRIDM